MEAAMYFFGLVGTGFVATAVQIMFKGGVGKV